MIADLHLHTTRSDGTHTPEETLQKAAEAGIKITALTDHDMLGDITIHANDYGILCINGVELSTVNEGQLIHILGYGIDSTDTVLKDLVHRNRLAVKTRDMQVLQAVDSHLTNEYVNYKYDRRRGGWKLLNYLIDKQICSDSFSYMNLITELHMQVVAYMTPCEAVNAIHHSGGLCVLAHPGYQRNHEEAVRLINQMCLLPIDGIESLHPHNSQRLIDYIKSYCREKQLLETGGSDWHGNLPDRRIRNPEVDTERLCNFHLLEKYIKNLITR